MTEIEARIEAMGRNQFNPDLKHTIIGKMAVENTTDLSDAEIDRILSPCVAVWLPQIAKMFRDCRCLACPIGKIYGSCNNTPYKKWVKHHKKEHNII